MHTLIQNFTHQLPILSLSYPQTYPILMLHGMQCVKCPLIGLSICHASEYSLSEYLLRITLYDNHVGTYSLQYYTLPNKSFVPYTQDIYCGKNTQEWITIEVALDKQCVWQPGFSEYHNSQCLLSCTTDMSIREIIVYHLAMKTGVCWEVEHGYYSKNILRGYSGNLYDSLGQCIATIQDGHILQSTTQLKQLIIGNAYLVLGTQDELLFTL